MLQALELCGIPFLLKESGKLLIYGQNGHFKIPHSPLYLGNSGTSLRFLTAVLALQKEIVIVTGNPAMQQRPIHGLVEALCELGVEIYDQKGCPPVTIKGPLNGGVVTLSNVTSSQFVSAILIAAPYALKEIKLRVDGPLISEPYVKMTCAMMQQFGAYINTAVDSTFHVSTKDRYQLSEYTIESDFSSASYFFAAIALIGGSLRFNSMSPSKSLQGDWRVLQILEQMGGIHYYEEQNDLVVEGSGKTLRGGVFDMADCSDMVLTVGALAAYAQGKTILNNIGHIRFKETDRIHALSEGLAGIGIKSHTTQTSITIEGGYPNSGKIKTYDDHRMAMAFAIVQLKNPSIEIDNPGCCAKTFPHFFDLLKNITKQDIPQKTIA
jgi:3-phosphoshikimate 1-carboxyvinyltransferase